MSIAIKKPLSIVLVLCMSLALLPTLVLPAAASEDPVLTDVTSMTLYNLIEEVTTEPEAGTEYAIQWLTDYAWTGEFDEDGYPIFEVVDPTPLETGFHQQSQTLVTITPGLKTTDDENTIVQRAYIRATLSGDVFYLIGGRSVEPDEDGENTIYMQSDAFFRLFDSCGGALVFNTKGSGHQYGCVNGGVTNADILLFTHEIYELDSISVELDGESRFTEGDTASTDNVAKVIGTYAKQGDDSATVTAELRAEAMIQSVTFLDSNGQEVDTYSDAVSQLKVVVSDANLGITKDAVVDIVYQGGETEQPPVEEPTEPTEPPVVNVPPVTSTPKTEEPAEPTTEAPSGLDTNTAAVVVGDETLDVGEVVVDTDKGTTTVVVDSASLSKQLESIDQQPSHNVTIVVPTGNDGAATAVAQMDAGVIETLTENDMSLTVISGGVSYAMPAGSMDTAAILAELGAESASDVTLDIAVSSALDDETNSAVAASIELLGGEIVIPAMSFTITASYDGNTCAVSSFDAFVSRTIEITEDQAKRITTALVIEADGTSRHVPTYVFQEGGKWYATINSMTNSTYVLIYNFQGFEDTQGTWYDSAVTEMASRKIVTGIDETTFAGGNSVTRAEFISIVVRAMGLPENGDTAAFTDIDSDAWYAGAVGTALAYGLVTGEDETTFGPDVELTRQEAMTILHQMAVLSGMSGEEADLEGFIDAEDVADWAEEAARYCVGSGLIEGFDNGTLRPTSQITRAETATVILRLLRASVLVDDRTGQY